MKNWDYDKLISQKQEEILPQSTDHLKAPATGMLVTSHFATCSMTWQRVFNLESFCASSSIKISLSREMDGTPHLSYDMLSFLSDLFVTLFLDTFSNFKSHLSIFFESKFYSCLQFSFNSSVISTTISVSVIAAISFRPFANWRGAPAKQHHAENSTPSTLGTKLISPK